jgi:predicted phosphoribosyltransferase
MLAAVEFVKKNKPDKIIVATPVASDSAVLVVKPKVDELLVLHIDYSWTFAVASFYEDFSDMTDQEVIEWLNKPAR